MTTDRRRDESPGQTSRVEKLGVKPGHLTLLVGITDPMFLAELQNQGARITTSATPDLIFCAVESRAALQQLSRLAKRMKRQGALWTIRRKGSPLVSQADVHRAGKAAGLVDVKVVRFSDTHTADKFVVPLAQR